MSLPTSSPRKAKGKGLARGQTSRSVRAGLNFPVGRISRYLRKGRYATRVGVGAAVYLAAALEYLTAEMMDLAGKVSKSNRKKRIIPRHLLCAVRCDDELNRVFQEQKVMIPNAGNFHLDLSSIPFPPTNH